MLANYYCLFLKRMRFGVFRNAAHLLHGLVHLYHTRLVDH